MKRIIFALLVLLPFFTKAQYINRDGYSIWKGQMSIGKIDLSNPVSSAWLEIGKDSTTKGLRLARVIDSSYIAGTAAEKKGLIFYQIRDRTIYYHNGTYWVKTASIVDADSISHKYVTDSIKNIYFQSALGTNKLFYKKNDSTLTWVSVLAGTNMTITKSVDANGDSVLTFSSSGGGSGVDTLWTANHKGNGYNLQNISGLSVKRTTIGGSTTYATWNPIDKSSDIILDVTNLITTDNAGAGGFKVVRATIGLNSGDWFWEITPTVGGSLRVGIADASESLSANLGSGVNGYAYTDAGTKANNGSTSAFGAGWGTGDVVGVHFQATTGKLEFFLNGVTQGDAFTGIPAGTYYPALSTGLTTFSFAANFGQSAFFGSVPGGANSGVYSGGGSSSTNNVLVTDSSGNIGIGKIPTNNGLDINHAVWVNKDSIPTTTGKKWTLRLDDSTGQLSKDSGISTADYSLDYKPVVAKTDSVIISGDSYSAGSGASSLNLRWTSQLCSWMGATEYNMSIGGTTLEKRSPVDWINPTNFIDRLATVPVKSAKIKLLIISYGLNDMGYTGANYNPTNFKIDFDSALHYLTTVKKYSAKNILILPPYWVGQASYNLYASMSGLAAPTVARHLDFVNAASETALKWGTLYYDIFHAQLANDTTLISGDNIHPTDSGHLFIARSVADYLNVRWKTGIQQAIDENNIFTKGNDIITDSASQKGLSIQAVRPPSDGLDGASLTPFGLNVYNKRLPQYHCFIQDGQIIMRAYTPVTIMFDQYNNPQAGIGYNGTFKLNQFYTGDSSDVQFGGSSGGGVTNALYFTSVNSTTYPDAKGGAFIARNANGFLRIGGSVINTGEKLQVVGTSSFSDTAKFNGLVKLNLLNSGTVTDSLLTVDANGIINKRSLSSIGITELSNATDANFTATANSSIKIPNGTLTANRTITMPTGVSGQKIIIWNRETVFTVSLSGATVVDWSENTVTIINANTRPVFVWQDSKWVLEN